MRTPTQEDISKVLELMNICFKDEIEDGMELPTPSLLLTKIEQGKIQLLIEEEDSTLIAFIVIQAETTEKPAQINMIGVDPAYRRNGIGTRLLEFCLDIVREKNWRKIKVYVRPWNIPMRKLMARFGFLPEGYLRKEFLNEDVILYSFFR
ncbi:MAG: GNAT family N-acetyltransferase [Candidatus Heimdallarchaeota archaeon]|nr:MAG: GNAT family N-acetyltransferase [Candidatus Heimdallarchaeota archaeon]